jgi:hypothetical protein
MKGIVDKIWENSTSNGKKYWVVQVGDERYSVWDPDLLEGLCEGDQIDYEWRKSGGYKKITSLTRYEPQEVSLTQTERKNEQIVRMSCLRTAGEILACEQLDIKRKIEKVLDTSKIFEKYVVTGEIPDEYKILLESYDKKKA